MRYHKQEVGYWYPSDKICATCIYSYKNSYGDKQCKILVPEESLIDGGAVCNKWEKEEYVVLRN